MKIALRVLLLLAAGYAAACLLLVLARNRIVFPVQGGETGEPLRIGMTDGARVAIATADGERLAAWWLPPRGDSARSGAVIWFHGNGETVRGLAPIIRELRPARAGLLVVDYRGYGESTGRTTIPGTLKDAEAAWTWLAQRPDVDSTRIVIYGRSVGSGPAAWLAARHHPAGLILESAFTSLRAMAAAHYSIFPSFLAGSGYDNLAAVRQVRAPALFMHGQTDAVVPIAMGRELAAEAAGPAEFWEIPGAGHNQTYDARLDEYARRFKAFVARVAE